MKIYKTKVLTWAKTIDFILPGPKMFLLPTGRFIQGKTSPKVLKYGPRPKAVVHAFKTDGIFFLHADFRTKAGK